MKIIPLQQEIPKADLAQKLITDFRNNALGKSELTRIEQAEQLCYFWQKNHLPNSLLPAIPERNDYWYLVQLLTNDGQLTQEKLPNTTFILDQDFLFIPDGKKLFAKLELPTSPASRNELDRLIDEYQTALVTAASLSPKKYILALPSYSQMLLLGHFQHWPATDHYAHLAGYRISRQGHRFGLIGGNALFGGHRFIDSYFLDKRLTHTWLPLVCVRKHA